MLKEIDYVPFFISIFYFFAAMQWFIGPPLVFSLTFALVRAETVNIMKYFIHNYTV